LQRQSRAWPHLDLVSFGDCDREAGRDGVALARRQREALRGYDVEPGSVLSRTGRKRQALAMRQALEVDFDHFDFFRVGRRPPFFAGPLAAFSSIRRTASSSVTAFGSAPLGKVACVVPSLA